MHLSPFRKAEFGNVELEETFVKVVKNLFQKDSVGPKALEYENFLVELHVFEHSKVHVSYGSFPCSSPLLVIWKPY